MQELSMRIAAFGALFITVAGLTYVRPTSAAGSARRGADYFTNVELTTQHGTKVHFYDDLLKGKIVVIDLFYTECRDSCPLETARLAQVQNMLGDRVGKDIFFYSISIDPKQDSPDVLKAYANKYHVGPGWLFLNGKKEDIDLISKKLGLYSDPDPSDRDGHTPSVLLGNEPTGQWIRNSALDNPRYLAVMIGDWLDNWKNGAKAGKSYADAPRLSITDRGQYIFATHCAACHSIGRGDRIGPDLQGVTNVRDRAWLTRFIQTPEKMLAEKDPIATALFAKYKQVNMPNLRLADAEASAVIDYLEARTGASHGDTSSPDEEVGAKKTESGAATTTRNK
jgi:protein SCO1/2